jgi:hypothetical protein
MIDLKREFVHFLDVEGDFGIGRWVVLRHFTSELSDYWEEAAQEAIGGPKYNYVDTLVRAYSAPAAFGMAMTAEGKTRLEVGDMPTRSTVYYFKSSVVVEEEDIIYEINWRKKEKPAEIVYKDEDEDLENGKVAPKKKAEILKVIDYSSDTAGAVEYIKVFAEEHMV